MRRPQCGKRRCSRSSIAATPTFPFHFLRDEIRPRPRLRSALLSEPFSLEKRVALCRLAIWLLTLLFTLVLFRETYPMAWQVAAFGAIFTLLWPLARRGGRSSPLPPSEDAPPSVAEESAPAAAPAFSGDAFVHAIDIGVDLAVITALVN